MKQTENAFLSLQNVTVEYTSGKKIVHAVNGVSLELEKGKTLGLVGETGAGKTTVAKTIMRILPDRSARITGGEIRMNGKNLLTASEEEMQSIRGNQIAMIFQDPMTALNPLMTVGEQILEVIHLHNKELSKQEATDEAIRILETVGIPGERFVEYPHQFSGGMKQRVVIAIALVCNPELLLADEPTTALDVTIQAQVLELIKELQQKIHTSMILITHDLGVVAETCDDVAVMYAGEIVEVGNKWDVFEHPAHPYTEGLFHALPIMNKNAKRLKPITGMPPDPTVVTGGCAFCPRCPYATEECAKGKIELIEVGEGHFSRCRNFERGGGNHEN